MSVNKVILVGRLGQTPEVRYTPSGAAVGNFSIATNETWMDKTNQKQERTEWHKIVVWGKTAENCNQFLAKGRQVYVEGRLQTRQWQDKDGQTKYTTEVVAQTVQFLGANAGAGSGASAGNGDRYSQGNMPQNMDDMGGAPMGNGSSSNSFGASYQSSQPSQSPQSSHSSQSSQSSMMGGGSSMPYQQQSYSPPSSPGNMEPSFTEDDIPF